MIDEKCIHPPLKKKPANLLCTYYVHKYQKFLVVSKTEE